MFYMNDQVERFLKPKVGVRSQYSIKKAAKVAYATFWNNIARLQAEEETALAVVYIATKLKNK